MAVHMKPFGVFDAPKIDNFTTTGNDYVDVPIHWPDDMSETRAYWPTDKLGGKTLRFSAASNSLKVQILASLDGGASFPITAEPEFTIATATPVIKVIGEYYHALKIQVKPAVNDAHGTLTVQATGSTLPSMAGLSVTALLDKTGLATENTLSTIDGKLAKGDQNKASSLSVTPATDITDGRYIGDIKFGESLPAGIAIIGKVGIDQVTANANEVVVKTSALPSGAATETTLNGIKADVATIKSDMATEASLSSIDDKLPALTLEGKIPVDANIGSVDVNNLPAENLGQQLSAASLSVAPATDITDPTYIGDIRFGESLPAGTNIIGKVGIDQTTPGTTNGVVVNSSALPAGAATETTLDTIMDDIALMKADLAAILAILES